MRLWRKSFPPPQNTPEDLAEAAAHLTLSKWKKVFAYADFRLFWVGAFLSFSGSWVQNVAQGYYVFQLTRDESALGLVSFCSSFPVFLLGFLAGTIADRYDKRKLMIVTQLIFAVGAIYLAIATWSHFVTYTQIVVVALILGTVSTVEMPTRQSIVSRVVPPEDLGTAIPITGLTFNASRIVGPSLGTWLLSVVGVAACYLVNGLSFLALIWTAIAIKADLTAAPRQKEPMRDLIFEGFFFTFRDKRLRTVFLLEAFTGIFGVFYASLMPAITGRMLGLNDHGQNAAKLGLGIATTFVGAGAIAALFLNTALNHLPLRGLLIRLSMTVLGLALVGLSFVREPIFAFPLFFLTGLCTVMQFNTSNTVFQILATERNRGRVLSMHIWALNGLSPFGLLFFGWLASASRGWHHSHIPKFGPFEMATNTGGPALALLVGGVLVLFGAVGAWLSRSGLHGLSPDIVSTEQVPA
jgi:MFS family permease